MIWSRNAESSVEQLAAALASTPQRLAASSAHLAPLAPNFAAVERMSDATGMLQHSLYSVPDRRHGYCIDDNARALMLMTQFVDIDPDLRDKWTTIYGAFVQYAWNPHAAPLSQFHELRSDLVRGHRVGGFERPDIVGARRDGA